MTQSRAAAGLNVLTAFCKEFLAPIVVLVVDLHWSGLLRSVSARQSGQSPDFLSGSQECRKILAR